MKILRKLFGSLPLPAPDRSVMPRPWRYYVAEWKVQR